jgi:hypothetical protein
VYGRLAVAGLGDVNADGFADIAFGVGGLAQGSGPQPTSEVDIFEGTAKGVATTPTDRLLCPPTTIGQFGVAFANPFDVNGDGYSDVLVSAGDGAEPPSDGAYLYLGGASGVATAPTLSLAGHPNTGGNFGLSVSADDMNGDGYSDLAIGSPAAFSNEGLVDIYLGGPVAIHSPPDDSYVGTFPSSDYEFGFGSGVAFAGDINRDSFADLVAGPTVPGATIYWGAGTGLGTPSTPSMIQPSPAQGLFGYWIGH